MKHLDTSSFLETARARFNELGLIDVACPWVLMVSGGSDSVALAHIAKELAVTGQPLRVLHFNHQLRGNAADEDQAFVEELCAHLGFSCTVATKNVAAEAASTGEGTEQAGRRLRYNAAFEALAALTNANNNSALTSQTAQESCCPDNTNNETKASSSNFGNAKGEDKALSPTGGGFILTAHTASDRAETFLQRIIVGGGGSSLASIPQKNGSIVRPLLDFSRAELRSWLTAYNQPVNGQLWREDATNDDTHYSRAFVRHELLPLLHQRNPRIVESLNKTATVLASESDYLDSQAAQLLPLTTSSFEAPVPLLRRAIYLACNEAIAQLAPDARITFDHIELIASEGNKSNFACQIPGGIEVRNKKGLLTFSKAKPPKHDPRNPR